MHYLVALHVSHITCFAVLAVLHLCYGATTLDHHWQCTYDPTHVCHAHRPLEYFSISQVWSLDDAEVYGFSCFPEVLCQLPSLQEIYMDNQQLLQLPLSLSDAKKLAVLEL